VYNILYLNKNKYDFLLYLQNDLFILYYIIYSLYTLYIFNDSVNTIFGVSQGENLDHT